MTATAPTESFQRDWIIKHGVSNLRSLTTALECEAGLEFTAVNPSLRGKVDERPPWVMAWIRPADMPDEMPRSWWVGVVQYGNGMVVHSEVPVPWSRVVPTLQRCAVSEASFKVKPAEPTAWNPFTAPANKRRDGRFVYFIGAEGSDLIKIGVAADIQQRLNSLQTGCPVLLRVLAVIPGVGKSVESELHQRFAADRVRGEWFQPSDHLLGYIKANGRAA